jgi:hypothetical protein
MTDAQMRLIERLKKEGEKTLDFFTELQIEDWSRAVYTEGAQWTVLEVLTHFVNAEASVYRLVVNIVDGGDGVPEDFDLDRYNERKVATLQDRSHTALLEEFWSLRQRTIALTQSFTAADLEKIGRHPFLGLARVEDIVKLMYRHNQLHQREIRRLLKSPPQ